MSRHRSLGASGSLVMALLSSGCSGNDTTTSEVPLITDDATFVAGGSIGEVWITDAAEGDELILADADANEVARGTADRLGSLILRPIEPADGYTVRRVKGKRVEGTKPFRVLSVNDTPDATLYQQPLVQGLNYVKMRDGIELAMTVRLPSGMTLADGPFPTIIEYSGYQVAAPGDLFTAAVQAVSQGTSLDALSDPLLPATSTAVGSVIAGLLGYAAVSVQMRGSGCSGGDFELFDLPTTYDGYDAVELVAAQPWVKGGKVGLAGISFSGISQLFVGGANPPHLAAIAPLSVTDDLYTGTGFPGGVFNDGFPAEWIAERQANAAPAPEAGAQPYAVQLVTDGDAHCEDNQRLRLQTIDLGQVITDNPFRVAELVDNRTPANWVGKVDVPVFLVGQFQDEQTGGHFPEMLDKLDANPNVWVTLQNGVHPDSLGPGSITRWIEFLDLFVGDRIPSIPPTVSTLSAELYKAVASGSPSMALPPTRFDSFTDVELAKAEFEKDPRVRILFDSGGGDVGPGALQPVWELSFDSWPVKTATPKSYYLAPNGELTEAMPSAGEASYVGDPSKRPRQTLDGNAVDAAWSALPPYNWTPVADGAALGFSSAALAQDVVLVGASSLDLTLKSSAKDTDIQVTLSDVRPDGQEMYVQSGWLRASHRFVDAALSSSTDPIQTHLEANASDMPVGTFETLRIQIYPVAYAFRAGHKIRITIQAPGGDRPRWSFATIEDGSIQNTIQLGPSKLVLPIAEGAMAGAPAPPCPSNRGMPCRAYVAASNGG